MGDLFELNLDVHVTSLTNTGGAPEFLISRIDANGNTYNLNGVNITATGNFAVSVGAGLDNHSFGDQIQLDLDIPAGDSLSAQVSIIGKG